MPDRQRGNTLFEAVPALSAISTHGAGAAKLIPVGFDHPAFHLMEGNNRIGRDPGQNQHVVVSSHVSRSHCDVVLAQGRLLVRDLDSHNGTWVNGVRVKEQALQPGDKLGLSRRVSFVLVLDSELVKPIGMEINLGGSVPAAAPVSPSQTALGMPALLPSRPGDPARSAAHLSVPTPVAAVSGERAAPSRLVSGGAFADEGTVASSEALPEEGDPDLITQLKLMEGQRNVLAILYQVSLRCLMAETPKESEKLLINVLQRLVPLDAGFLLYRSAGSWEASLCPGGKYRPPDALVRAFFDLARERGVSLLIDQPRDLQALGIQSAAALVVPLIQGEEVSGVIGAIAGRREVLTAETVDILVQLSHVAAAALRSRAP